MDTIQQTTKQKIISFFLRHPDAFVRMVSEFYAFKPNEIQKHFGQLQSRWLSCNKYCHWDSATISMYRDQIDWPLFSLNSNALGDVRLIDEFITDIVWTDFDSNSNKDQCITYNQAVPWSEEFISKYENFIDFSQLSWCRQVPWTENLIEKYFDRWNWEGLSANNNLPWSEEFIDKYADLFDWEGIIFFNDNFPWNLSIAKKYKHKLLEMDRDLLLENGMLWNDMAIIEEFADILDWEKIVCISGLPWYEENLLERWKDHLENLSFECNSTFVSNPQFFEANLDKYMANDAALFWWLSSSQVLPWSISFIERFKDYWQWSIMSWNSSLPWSSEFVDYYIKYWDWGNQTRTEDGFAAGAYGIICNEGISWDIDWILKYEQFINVEAMSYEAMIWEKVFKPNMDEQTIDSVFRII